VLGLAAGEPVCLETLGDTVEFSLGFTAGLTGNRLKHCDQPPLSWPLNCLWRALSLRCALPCCVSVTPSLMLVSLMQL
jgi:hypothetical protein